MALLVLSNIAGRVFVQEDEARRQVGRHHQGQGGDEERPPGDPRHHDGGQAVAEHVLGRHDDGRQVLVQRDLGHLEDGDGVVAHHVGPTEGLREEEEDEESHGQEDGPLVQLGGRLSPAPGRVIRLSPDDDLQRLQLLVHLRPGQTPELTEVVSRLLPPPAAQQPGGRLRQEDDQEGGEEGDEGPGDAGESPGEKPTEDVHQEVPGVGGGRHQDGQRPPQLRGGDLSQVDGGDGDAGPDTQPGDCPRYEEMVETGGLPGQQPANGQGQTVQQDGHTAAKPGNI